VSSLFVLASFGLFARDELAGASNTQQAEITSGTSDPTLPSPARHKQPRRIVDRVARALLSPFSALAPSGSRWAARGVPTILALLVYGFGLGFLARVSKGLP
jgi:hypothetical protein